MDSLVPLAETLKTLATGFLTDNQTLKDRLTVIEGDRDALKGWKTRVESKVDDIDQLKTDRDEFKTWKTKVDDIDQLKTDRDEFKTWKTSVAEIDQLKTDRDSLNTQIQDVAQLRAEVNVLLTRLSNLEAQIPQQPTPTPVPTPSTNGASTTTWSPNQPGKISNYQELADHYHITVPDLMKANPNLKVNWNGGLDWNVKSYTIPPPTIPPWG